MDWGLGRAPAGRSENVIVDELQQLETWAAPLLAKLGAAERRVLARRIGTTLRRSQAQRIKGQLNPDGSAYAPRKREQAGQIKRRKERMFQRITQARHLKVEVSDQAVAVGFFGRVARIAMVHQEGQTDRVSRNGPSVRYERRQLLGFSDAERSTIRDLIVEHLAQ